MQDPNENADDETLNTVQASAGVARRPAAVAAMSALADAPEPSAEELDDRQAEIGETRRSGPTLPEGGVPGTLSLAAADDSEAPTEVDEPRPKDR